MKNGKYFEQAEGIDRPINLSIEINNGKIVKIASESNNISDLEKNALDKMTNRIIEKQSVSVDVVSGATVSSKGILAATKQAIVDAEGNPENFEKTSMQKADVEEKGDYQKWIKKPEKIAKTIDTDLVIVGSGIAGLAAAVQAGEDHVKTIVLEKNGFVGGNGSGVEGMLGAETKMQKAAGITFAKEKVVKNELETIQYQADGSFWVDLVGHTADNIDWLIKNGV